MKINEIKKIATSELEKLLAESRIELRKLRFDLSFGKIKNVRQVRVLKKKIAQILTELSVSKKK